MARTLWYRGKTYLNCVSRVEAQLWEGTVASWLVRLSPDRAVLV